MTVPESFGGVPGSVEESHGLIEALRLDLLVQDGEQVRVLHQSGTNIEYCNELHLERKASPPPRIVINSGDFWPPSEPLGTNVRYCGLRAVH